MKIFTRVLLFLILPLLLLSASCSKDGGNIKAEGTVVDKTTGEPIPNAMVYLRHQQRSISTAGASGISSIASQQADANGKFSFTFVADRDYIYEVAAKKDNYYDDGNNTASVPSSGATDLKVPLQPYAYLNIHVVNANPFDNNDKILISSIFGSSNDPFYGQVIDKTLTGKVQGNQKKAIYWWVTKNGEEKSYKDSIYCLAFDTTLYEIKY